MSGTFSRSEDLPSSPRRCARWVAACRRGVALFRLRGEAQLPLRPLSSGGRGGRPPASRVSGCRSSELPLSLPYFHVPPSLPRVSPPPAPTCLLRKKGCVSREPAPGLRGQQRKAETSLGAEASPASGPASPAQKKGPCRNTNSQVVAHP